MGDLGGVEGERGVSPPEEAGVPGHPSVAEGERAEVVEEAPVAIDGPASPARPSEAQTEAKGKARRKPKPKYKPKRRRMTRW